MPGGRPKGRKDTRPRKRRRDASPLPLDNSAATAAVRADVALYAGIGLSEEQIAELLEISVEIVRAHFGAELKPGNVIEYARNIRRMRDSADGGSVNAQKALHVLLTQNAAGQELTANAAGRASAQRVLTDMGKKERSAIAAQTAERGTGWEGLLDTLTNRPN